MELGLNHKLYQVDVGYFCCGVVVEDDTKVVGAAPIMGWAVGKNWESVLSWVVKKKDYSIILVGEY